MPYRSKELKPLKYASLITAIVCLLLLSHAYGIRPDTQVELQWDANKEEDVILYRLYYGVDHKDLNNTIDITGRTTTSIVVSNLEPNTTYYFALTAIDKAGQESIRSGEIACHTYSLQTPSKPTDLKIKVKNQN